MAKQKKKTKTRTALKTREKATNAYPSKQGIKKWWWHFCTVLYLYVLLVFSNLHCLDKVWRKYYSDISIFLHREHKTCSNLFWVSAEMARDVTETCITHFILAKERERRQRITSGKQSCNAAQPSRDWRVTTINYQQSRGLQVNVRWGQG